jgi:hypothetical protein
VLRLGVDEHEFAVDALKGLDDLQPPRVEVNPRPGRAERLPETGARRRRDQHGDLPGRPDRRVGEQPELVGRRRDEVGLLGRLGLRGPNRVYADQRPGHRGRQRRGERSAELTHGPRRKAALGGGIKHRLDVRWLEAVDAVLADARKGIGADELLVAANGARPWLALRREMRIPPVDDELAHREVRRERLLTFIEAPERLPQFALGGLLRPEGRGPTLPPFGTCISQRGATTWAGLALVLVDPDAVRDRSASLIENPVHALTVPSVLAADVDYE